MGFINRPPKICHPERSIAIGFTNRNTESRDLLVKLPQDSAQGTVAPNFRPD